MSAWVHAPARGLEPVTKDDTIDVPADATFQPALISNEDLRAKANSSGYGKVPITPKEKKQREGGLSEYEEAPTFQPELASSPSLRVKANSSGYGSAVPQKKSVEVEVPTFQPELVTKTATVSSQWASKASSSSYGKAPATPRPKTAPQPDFSFKPELPQDPWREKATSSAYGKVVPQVKSPTGRPNSAPSSEFDGLAKKDVSYLSRHTLLKDKPEKEEPKPETNGRDFVLDGVRVSQTIKFQQPLLGSPKKLPDFDRSQALKEKATSSSYGLASPPSMPKPERAAGPAPFKFDMTQSVLDTKIEGPLKTALADKAHSHGYGVQSPAKADRPEPKAPEPVWNKTLKGSIPAELAPVPASRLNETVKSHDYGRASPAKADRLDAVLSPLWVPPSPSRALPEADPVPRSKLNDTVQSHYGKGYAPADLSRFDGEEGEGEN